MNECRLSMAISGAFLHPYDQTPIDMRYGEIIHTERLPVRQIFTLEGSRAFDCSEMRCVIVTNMAGTTLETYPDDTQRAYLERQTLLVGISSSDLPPAAWCELRASCPPSMPQGTSQVLWLSRGTWLHLKACDGVPVPVKVMQFPSNG